MSSKLRVLSESEVDAPEVDFVLVPGVGTSPVEEWAICSESWRTSLNPEYRVRLLAFDSGVVLDDSFSVLSLLEQGENLLRCIADLKRDDGLMRPLAFMCHSMGGLILKQALCIANAQSEKYGMALGSILGIVFLGVPHARANPDVLRETYLLILRSVSDLSKQAYGRFEDESTKLVDISGLFEDIELRATILTVYETKATKVRRKGLVSYALSQNLLVDKAIARTHSVLEQCFGLPNSHADICTLGKSIEEPDASLKTWIQYLMGNESVNFVQGRLKAYHIGSSEFSASTIFSYGPGHRISDPPTPESHTAPLITSGRPTTGAITSPSLPSSEISSIMNRFAPPRRLARLPCIMMDTPVRNKDFFGRESILKQLEEVLLPTSVAFSAEKEFQPNRSQKHVVLCGMGGLGKTSIAIEFAFRNTKAYDAIFWVRADEKMKLEQDFCDIANRLGLEDDVDLRNLVVSRELARGWLDNPKRVLNQESDILSQAEPNWLLIFDNADDPDILQDFWPVSANGSILITSRDPLAKTSPAIPSLAIDVPLFDEEETSSLLQQLAHVNGEKDMSLRIAQKLGGLPLAISQMAGIIRYQYMSFSEFLEMYEDEMDRKDLLGLEAGTTRQEARGNLASIWAVESLEPQARALLEICAFLDPDCIPESILLNGAAKINIENYPRGKLAFGTARADLLKRSLIKRSVGEKQYWIHRILQDSIQAKMSSEHMRRLFSAAVTLVSAAWGETPPNEKHNIQVARKREPLYPHVMFLKKVYETVCSDAGADTNLELAYLLKEAGWWHRVRGNNNHTDIFQLSLKICDRYPDHDTLFLRGDTHLGLAASYDETYRKEECRYHTNLLLNLCLNTGVTDVRLALAYAELGYSLMMWNEFEAALKAFITSAEIYKQLPDYWAGMDTQPRGSIGFVQWLMGDLEAAATTLEELMADRIKRFGPNDKESFRTGRIYHGLGNVYWSQGRMQESERCHNEALSRHQELIGNNHHRTSDVCHRVAQHCLRHGDLQTGIALVDQAMKVWRPSKSEYLPELARTTFFKSKLVRASGDTAAADALVEEAKNLRNSIPGAIKIPDGDRLTEEDFDVLVTFLSR